MTTLYQQLAEHLKKCGCSFHINSQSLANTEIWKTPEGGFFMVEKTLSSNSNIDNITRAAGVDDFPHEIHVISRAATASRK